MLIRLIQIHDVAFYFCLFVSFVKYKNRNKLTRVGMDIITSTLDR